MTVKLSTLQASVAKCVMQGLRDKEIAARMGKELKHIQSIVLVVRKKYGARSRTEMALMMALRKKTLVTDDVVEYMRSRPSGATGHELKHILGLVSKQGERALYRAKALGLLLAKKHPHPDRSREQRFWHPDHRAHYEAFAYVPAKAAPAVKREPKKQDKPAASIGGEVPGFVGRVWFTPPSRDWRGEIDGRECRPWVAAMLG